MTNVTALPEIDALADDDLLYVRDTSAPGSPDKRLPGSKMRPVGAKITHYYRAAGSITIPTIAAGAEGSATITVTGAAVGDNVLFNPTVGLPADLAITNCYVSAANTVTVRFRNLHASTSFSTAGLACVALVIRSTG